MSTVMKLYASLHAHSVHSDGVYTPTELAQIGMDEGYHALVLTDHDTISGTDEMIRACKERNIESLLGVEFSTQIGKSNVPFHMTAFHFDPEFPEMKEYLRKLSYKETEQTRVLFNRGVDIGYIKGITWDEVIECNEGISWLCNEHVFKAMKRKGLVKDLQYMDFFETCYGKYRYQVPTDIKFMDAEELIPLVHAAGGIAVAAHPKHLLDNIPYLTECGLDGIEVWHSMLTGAERRRALGVAMKYDLYVSGGADHEGLLGGMYTRFENPQSTEFYFPPLTLGTTKLFYEEIRDKKKHEGRREIMNTMLADDSLWITNGGISDNP